MQTSLPSAPLTAKQKHWLARRWELHRRYERAVQLYDETELTLSAIARQCGVSRMALGMYLRRHWRELVMRRNHVVPTSGDLFATKIVKSGEESEQARAKYRKAVEACASTAYIEWNTSQIARKFGLDGTALANFMRLHYEGVAVWREKLRRELGLADNKPRGLSQASREHYAKAVELYSTTELTQPEVARRCGVSLAGFSQHLRFYHKEVLQRKRGERKRAAADNNKTAGALMGNGRRHEPAAGTEKKYAPALALYQYTSLPLCEIARRTGVNKESLRSYLRKWHAPLVRARQGAK